MQTILSDAKFRDVALCRKCKRKLDSRGRTVIELCPAHRIKAKQR